MAYARRTTARPSLMSRLRPGRKHHRRTTHRRAGPAVTHTTHTTHTRHTHAPAARHNHYRGTYAAPAAHHHHHRRRPSMGDKLSGALLKLRGSLTRRPGMKAAGTRRMRGTDGRGARPVRRY